MSTASVEIVVRRLSIERLGPYRDACDGNFDAALELYVWNSHVSAAVWELLGYLEIVVRNVIHERLAAWHVDRHRPGNWYDDPAGVLDDRTTEAIAAARVRIALAGHKETPGRVVAELNFGFWRQLTSRRYDSALWVPAVHHAFPHYRGPRRTLQDRLEHLNFLRNRIAHHEPVHARDLPEDQHQILTVAAGICPTTSAWIGSVSRLPEVLAQRPVTARRDR